MAANNQGIFHLNLNGAVACKRMNAHMFIKIDEFRTTKSRRCARCVALLAKMDASQARREARQLASRSAPNFEGRVIDSGTENGYAIYSNVALS